MAVPLQLGPAPLRSPVFDGNGTMTLEWQRYFMQLFHVSANVGAQVTTNTTNILDTQAQTAFDRTPQDAGAIAEEAAARVPADTARDFGPAIEEVLIKSQTDAGRDFGPAIENAAALLLTDARTPQVTRADLDDIYARLAPIESMNRGSAANASTTDFDAAGAAEEISRQQAQQFFKDYSPDIEAAARLILLERSAPQVTRADLDDIYARLAPIESMNRGSAANASTTDFDAVGAAEEIARQQAQQLFKDFSPDVEAALRMLLMNARTPRVTPADLDELRNLIASADLPRASGFEGWNNWTPTVTAGGSMTVSSLVINDAQYIVVGAVCFFKLFLAFTLGGTASFEVDVVLPLISVGQTTAVTLSAFIFGATGWQLEWGIVYGGSTQLGMRLNNQANWPLGINTQIICEGFYRIG
jgi:hypothetical protein